MVQWLSPHAPTPGTPVPSLVWELRSCKLHSTDKNQINILLHALGLQTRKRGTRREGMRGRQRPFSLIRLFSWGERGMRGRSLDTRGGAWGMRWRGLAAPRSEHQEPGLVVAACLHL